MYRACVLGLVLFGLVGCGGDQFTVYPVTGTISFDGKPMEGGGSIAFVPSDGQDGKAAGGVIDEEGNYTLSTYSEGDGSIPGNFRVIITQTAVEEPESTPDGTPPPKEPVPYLPADKIIPAAYSDHKGSPLTATVKAEKNELNFDLKRDAGAPAPQQTGA